MRRQLDQFAFVMIAVLLLTLLSPGYAWEATAGSDPHGERSARIDPHEPCSPGPAETPGSGQQDQAPHDLHRCAGHMLGHLVAAVDSIHGAFSPDFRAGHVFGRYTPSPSQYPDPLDHPPRVAGLA